MIVVKGRERNENSDYKTADCSEDYKWVIKNDNEEKCSMNRMRRINGIKERRKIKSWTEMSGI